MLPHTGWDIVHLFTNLPELITVQEHQNIGKQISILNEYKMNIAIKLYNCGKRCSAKP